MKQEPTKSNHLPGPSRRKFIGQIGTTAAVTLAAGAVGIEPLLKTRRSTVQAATGSNQRANECAKLRRDAAVAGLQATPQNLQHPANGDESLYADKRGN